MFSAIAKYTQNYSILISVDIGSQNFAVITCFDFLADLMMICRNLKVKNKGIANNLSELNYFACSISAENRSLKQSDHFGIKA